MLLNNVTQNQTFGYQLLRIKGTAHGASKVSVIASSTIATVDFSSGHFKALILLTAGANTIQFQDDKGRKVEYHCTYDPTMINVSPTKESQKHYVRIVYFIPKGSSGNFLGPSEVICDIESAKKRLTMAILMMQLFCAQNLQELGYEPKTFGIQVDAKGDPVVTIFTSQRTEKEWMQLYSKKDGGAEAWQTKVQELNSTVPQRSNVLDLCIFSASGYDKKTRNTTMATALGGFPLALFAGITMHCWASTVQQIITCFKNEKRMDTSLLPDDSCGRGTYWANFATCLGAFMHEAGHGFSLPHTSDGIMARGFDHLNRFFCISEPGCNLVFDSLKNEGGCYWHADSAKLLLQSPFFNKAFSTFTSLPKGIPPLQQENRITKRFDYSDGNFIEQSKQNPKMWIEVHGTTPFASFEELQRNEVTKTVYIFDKNRTMILKMEPNAVSWISGPKETNLNQVTKWNRIITGQWSSHYSATV